MPCDVRFETVYNNEYSILLLAFLLTHYCMRIIHQKWRPIRFFLLNLSLNLFFVCTSTLKTVLFCTEHFTQLFTNKKVVKKSINCKNSLLSPSPVSCLPSPVSRLLSYVSRVADLIGNDLADLADLGNLAVLTIFVDWGKKFADKKFGGYRLKRFSI